MTSLPLTSLPLGARVVAGAFATSGIIHLVRPQVFEPLVPSMIGHEREVVLASGVAELACAAGLLVPATRRVAGPASAALLVGVFPGNVQMTVDAVRSARRRPTGARVARAAGTVARLPLQWPLVKWAWSARTA
ncbi:DoxX family protein [Calidifontibacter terrae]